MVSKIPKSWFLSEQGRKFTFAVVTSTGLGLTVARFVPNTILLGKYKEFVQYYRNGKPVEVAKELQERCQKCLDILRIPEVNKKLISPFSVFGYDLFHAGSSFSKYGVIVGIPVNFTYKSMADIMKDDIQVNHKQVNWSSENGQKLADALILPEKVQEFAICREILMTQNIKVILDSVYPYVSIFAIYNITCYINNRFNLYAAPLSIRSTLYTIMTLFGLGIYFLMKDMTEVHYESEVDKKLVELDPEFVESGVIFYDKLLKRNQVLRELMGSEGESKYSKLGNENFGLRQPRMALIHRKQFFESKLKEKTEDSKSMHVLSSSGNESDNLII